MSQENMLWKHIGGSVLAHIHWCAPEKRQELAAQTGHVIGEGHEWLDALWLEGVLAHFQQLRGGAFGGR